MKVFYQALFGIMLMAVVLMVGVGQAQAAEPGAIAFVGYNADGTDGFAFVLLSGTNAHTSVFFTDKEWTGSDFTTGEGVIEWQAPAVPLAAGTVVTMTNISTAPVTSHGTTVSTINLDASNEVLYAFQGVDSDTPSQFLAAIANDAYASIGSDLLLNTGLTIGTTAVEITGDEDVMVYTGGTTFANEAAAHTAVGNSANWTTEDGSGDQAQNATTPDFPNDVIGSMIISAPTAVTLSAQAVEQHSSHSLSLILAAVILTLATIISLNHSLFVLKG